ncbi:hypothetical protein F2Q68_00013280 [Brassica cretica]|uniref:Uncharacterized protein n=1 Tax=Brassica cretica TaxID=69181 RepID=A0A8S9HCM7_BRACR|nr:hypothetical protein F2Q68_00013280 [Brassica cretica]
MRPFSPETKPIRRGDGENRGEIDGKSGRRRLTPYRIPRNRKNTPLTDERAVVHQETNQLVTSGLTEASEKGDQEDEPDTETIFVPTMGAWSKPLRFTPPPTPPEPATPKLGFTEVVKSQIACFWPTINESIVMGHKHTKEKLAYPVQTNSRLPMEKLPPPVLKEDGSLRFPWAARMNQSSRNLFRAAESTYRPDGTPQVTIPSNVLRLGPENKEKYIVGQFHRCTNPPGGLIHAVLNRFGVCGMLMIVSDLLPLGVRHIASGLGEPMLTHRPRLDPTSMGKAKILVEIELDKPFPKLIALDDKQSNIYLVEVEYS